AHGPAGQLIGESERFYFFFLNVVLLRDLPGDLYESFKVFLEVRRGFLLSGHEFEQTSCKSLVLIDPSNGTLHQIDPGLHFALDFCFAAGFLPGFEYCLDGFGATTGTGTMHASASAPVMSAQRTAWHVEDSLGEGPTQRGFDQIGW